MGEAFVITATYVGIVDGLHTHEVRDEAGTLVGTNASTNAPDGWTLDPETGTWIDNTGGI